MRDVMLRPVVARGLSRHRFLIAAAGALLLAGTVELHPEAAHSVDGRERLVFTCDHDHNGTLHVEEARTEVCEACAACIHRLQTGDAGLTAIAGFVGMVAAEPRETDRDPATSSAHPLRQLARGPPALS
jgi:hypothetical protein